MLPNFTDGDTEAWNTEHASQGHRPGKWRDWIQTQVAWPKSLALTCTAMCPAPGLPGQSSPILCNKGVLVPGWVLPRKLVVRACWMPLSPPVAPPQPSQARLTLISQALWSWNSRKAAVGPQCWLTRGGVGVLGSRQQQILSSCCSESLQDIPKPDHQPACPGLLFLWLVDAGLADGDVNRV